MNHCFLEIAICIIYICPDIKAFATSLASTSLMKGDTDSVDLIGVRPTDY